MTHFVATVILPKGQHPTCDDQAETYVEPLVAAYDENTQVDPYQRVCFCVGGQQKAEAREQADEKFGTVDQMKETFAAEHPRPEGMEMGDAFFDWMAEQTKLWQAYSKPRFDFEQSVLDGMEQTPDPECYQCKGTGTHRSTYNPQSRWDWWVVGGRWPNEINGKNFGLVKDLPEDAVGSHIITPDGEWHARGKDGWWATFDADMSDEDWDNLKKGILSEHLEHTVVNIDCHI